MQQGKGRRRVVHPSCGRSKMLRRQWRKGEQDLVWFDNKTSTAASLRNPDRWIDGTGEEQRCRVRPAQVRPRTCHCLGRRMYGGRSGWMRHATARRVRRAVRDDGDTAASLRNPDRWIDGTGEEQRCRVRPAQVRARTCHCLGRRM